MEPIEYEVMAAVEGQHWWYSGMRAITAAWLDQVMVGGERRRILDAGCGTGGNVEFLGRYGTCVGIDVMTLAIERAVRRAPGRVARASVGALPFQTASFDLVTSFEVLYHRAVPDVPRALAETWRVLKRGGYVLLRLPAFGWIMSQHDRSVHTRERYTAAQVRTLLEDARFTVERLSYCNTLLFPLAVAERGAERLHAPAGGESALRPPGALLNTMLRTALEGEAGLLARGARFPWGLSVLALARRRE